jgi:excisionase family DNA binding protein
MSLSDLGSQTAAVRMLGMSSVPKSAEELLARLEAAVEKLESTRASLPLVLTVKAAAAQLSVSERTMRGLMASGEVPSVLVGGRRMVPSSALVELARPAALEAVRRAPVRRRVRAGPRLDMDAELAKLASVSKRRRG